MLKIYVNSTLVFFVAPGDVRGARAIITEILETPPWKTFFASREVGMCGVPITAPRVIICDDALLQPQIVKLTDADYTVVTDADRPSRFELIDTIAVVAPLSDAGLRRVRVVMGMAAVSNQRDTRAFFVRVRALIHRHRA